MEKTNVDAVEAAALVLDAAVEKFVESGKDDDLAYGRAVRLLIAAAEQRGRAAVIEGRA